MKIPLIDDTIDYTIPEGTQSGKVFFVRGKGIKTSRGTGDLYIEVIVEVPNKLSREQKKALEIFDEQTEIKQCSQMKQYKDMHQLVHDTQMGYPSSISIALELQYCVHRCNLLDHS